MHKNSLANLNPQAPSKGGRAPRQMTLSDKAVQGADLFARANGLFKNGKPNRSEAVNQILEAIRLALAYGETLTIDWNGSISVTLEEPKESIDKHIEEDH